MDRRVHFEGMELTEDENKNGFKKERIKDLPDVQSYVEAIMHRIDKSNIVIKIKIDSIKHVYRHLRYGKYSFCKDSDSQWLAFDFLTTCSDEQQLMPDKAVELANKNAKEKSYPEILTEEYKP